jgi:hypothetical protein
VRSLFLILFSVIYLISSTELHEFLKIPLLIEHFEEHKQEKDKLSFSEFLKGHYVGEENNDIDYNKNQKLPFKSKSDFSHFTNIFSTEPNIFLLCSDIPITTLNTFLGIQKLNITSNFYSSIWQPPKQT